MPPPKPKLYDMIQQRNIVRHFITRANALLAIGKWSESVEDSYWKLKMDLFKTEKMWELENPPFYWGKQLREDLTELNFILYDVWCLKFV